MLNKIKSFFFKTKDEVVLTTDAIDTNLTCASLSIEVALADRDFDDTEISTLKRILENSYSISKEKIEDLVKNAEQDVKDSTSLYEYTRDINDKFEYEQKLELLDHLWRISYADGSVDKYEEHLVRKISDLIHISHGDFIASKLKNSD
jgi:uncharacterized tellurite resistance protein B-like protein